MPVSKAQQKAVHKYVKAKYDRMELTVPKGRKDEIQAHAVAHGESVNGFIGRAISETIERDSSGTPSETAVNRPEQARGAGVVSLPSEALRTSHEGIETGKQPVSVDRTKAWENLSEIFHDMGAVDLEKARDERMGIVCLSPDTLETAQQAADAAGEAVADFMRRAVEAQAQRDETSRKLGINPATGGKLEKEA